MSDVGEAIKSKWLQCPFPNRSPNEASLTSGECYFLPTIPILFIWNGASIFISHLLRNRDKAIASQLLGSLIVRNYFQFTPARPHSRPPLLWWVGTIENTMDCEGQTGTVVIGTIHWILSVDWGNGRIKQLVCRVKWTSFHWSWPTIAL